MTLLSYPTPSLLIRFSEVQTNMENKKRSLNIIDVAIVLAVIAIIGGAVFRTYGKNNLFASGKDVTIEYTLEIKETEKEFRQLINTGDNVYFYSNGKLCGTVVSSKKNPSKTYVKNGSDELVIKHNPAHIDIFLTVRTDAYKTENGYFVGGSNCIAPGMNQRFYTDTFEFDAQVKNITETSSAAIG